MCCVLAVEVLVRRRDAGVEERCGGQGGEWCGWQTYPPLGTLRRYIDDYG